MNKFKMGGSLEKVLWKDFLGMFANLSISTIFLLSRVINAQGYDSMPSGIFQLGSN